MYPFTSLTSEDQKKYLFYFFLPLALISIVLLLIDYLNLYLFLVIGSVYVLGESFFINKAEQNKTQWILDDLGELFIIVYLTWLFLFY